MKRPHYAWAICLGCAIGQFFCVGVMSNVYAAMQPFILEQNGFSNTELAGIITMRSVVFVLCLCTARLYFRIFGERLGYALAAFFAAAAFFVFAVAKTLPMYYFGGALAGLAYGFGSMYIATVLLKRWFAARRGMALGVCSAASGLATIALSPVLSSAAQSRGLTDAFLLVSGLCLAAAILIYLLLRPSPEGCGLQPYDERTEEERLHEKNTFVPPKKMRILLIAAVGIVFCESIVSFSDVSILNTTAGIDPIRAAAALSAAGVGLMCGKMLFGLISDRLGSERATAMAFLMLLAGQLCCSLAETQSIVLMYTGAILLGLGSSVSTTGLSIWSLDFADEASQPKLMLTFQIAGGTGFLLVSLLPGLIADATGSYTQAYRLFFGLSVLSGAVLLAAYRKKKKA